MSPDQARTAAELLDDFIKLEWQGIFRTEVHVKLDNGARYVPNGGSQGVRLVRGLIRLEQLQPGGMSAGKTVMPPWTSSTFRSWSAPYWCAETQPTPGRRCR